MTTVKQGPLETAFLEFHQAHPEVYNALVRYAKEWRAARGANTRLGIKMLIERVRWELHLGENEEVPKLNNNHTAFYARLIMDQEDGLAGVFHLRQQKRQAAFGPGNVELEPSVQIVPFGLAARPAPEKRFAGTAGQVGRLPGF